MLQLKGIYKTFNAGTVNEKRAIDNLNLTLEDGDFVTIIGGIGAIAIGNGITKTDNRFTSICREKRCVC